VASFNSAHRLLKLLTQNTTAQANVGIWKPVAFEASTERTKWTELKWNKANYQHCVISIYFSSSHIRRFEHIFTFTTDIMASWSSR